MDATQQSVFRLTRWASFALLALMSPFATATALVVYDDALENAFADFSYGGTFNLAATSPVHTGTHSVSFASTGFDAFKVAASSPLDTATYPQLVFWFYGSTAQCNALTINLEIGNGGADDPVASGPVSGYTNCATGAGAWKQIVIDLTAAPISASGQYDRISFFDNSSGFGTAYFDDIALQSSVVDEIFANGFEGGSTPPPPVNTLTETANQPNGGMNAELFAWYDSNAQQRTAALAYNNGGTGPGGSHGGELRQFTYKVGANVRTVNASSSGAAGFGYIVSHPNDDGSHCVAGDSSSLGHFFAGTFTRVFQGRHHAIFRFQQNYPRYCSTAAPNQERDIPTTIDWIFSTGRDNPLWSITYDMSALPSNILEDDSRAPYGELLFDGAASEGAHSVIAGVGWGDRYKFTTTSAPVTYNSTWTWNTANTIPYVKLWTTTVDATMGMVQTQPITRQDAGGYFGSDRWNTTSASGAACAAGDDAANAHTMPCSSNWDYQSINYSIDPSSPSSSTNNTRLAWGTEFGFLGKNSYHINGSTYWGGPVPDATASGYPRKSYSLYVVLGTHATDSVATQVTQMETAQSLTLGASVGTVASSGSAGVNRSDTVSYSPLGYDPVYDALTFNASANAVTATIAIGSGTLRNPLIVIHNYTSGSYPSTVKLNGAVLTMDSDYFPSLRTATGDLWITLNRSLSGSNTLQISP